MSKDCVFCKIINKEIPSNLIYEDEHLVAFNDINPAAPVHVLVVPKRHIENITEMTEGDKDLLGHIMMTIGDLSRKLGIDDDGFRTVINTKDNGGQTVYHLHCHILGGRFMNWPPG